MQNWMNQQCWRKCSSHKCSYRCYRCTWLWYYCRRFNDCLVSLRDLRSLSSITCGFVFFSSLSIPPIVFCKNALCLHRWSQHMSAFLLCVSPRQEILWYVLFAVEVLYFVTKYTHSILCMVCNNKILPNITLWLLGIFVVNFIFTLKVTVTISCGKIKNWIVGCRCWFCHGPLQGKMPFSILIISPYLQCCWLHSNFLITWKGASRLSGLRRFGAPSALGAWVTWPTLMKILLRLRQLSNVQLIFHIPAYVLTCPTFYSFIPFLLHTNIKYASCLSKLSCLLQFCPYLTHMVDFLHVQANVNMLHTHTMLSCRRYMHNIKNMHVMCRQQSY